MEKRGRSSNCGVCKVQDRKYKCPVCYVPYCSSSCYSSHVCVPYVEPPSSNRPSTIFKDETLNLEALKESEELRALLKSSPCLRDFLNRINTTHNPEGFMTLAMREPIFLDYADVVLRALSVKKEDS